MFIFPETLDYIENKSRQHCCYRDLFKIFIYEKKLFFFAVTGPFFVQIYAGDHMIYISAGGYNDS